MKKASKSFFQEFKEFIERGNVMDLAVAVVIGTAFTAIVNSAVSDLIMPFVSALTGGAHFGDMMLVIPLGSSEATITYGNFINAIIQFLIIALVVFLVIKGMNKLKSKANKAAEAEEKEKAHCIYCKEEILIGATRCPHCTAELPQPAKADIIS